MFDRFKFRLSEPAVEGAVEDSLACLPTVVLVDWSLP